MAATDPGTSPQTLTAPATAQAPSWRVVVLNDPVNLVVYVIMVFRRVFGFSLEVARRHTLEVHHLGRSVVWTGGREKAEAYVHALQRWQLTAQLESDGSH